MRVIQLIDSLEPGGAERIAVNFANGLDNKIDKSFLCATRREGLLKNNLNNDIGYLFLDKRKSLDLKAVLKLKSFIRKHKINLIHAHSTSFFLAVIIKLFYPKIRIIWHDHYGNSEFLTSRKANILKVTSKYFSHVLCVNKLLESWGRDNLKCDHINYFPNFAEPDRHQPQTKLYGKDGKRIIHLANLRVQKDHHNLIKAFKKVVEVHPDWSLHSVGKDFEDEYAKSVKDRVSELKLEKNIFFYGSRPDVTNILNQSEIGVLSSRSEGLPLALLEYGLSSLPCVSTNVGDCAEVISSEKEGILVEKENETILKEALIRFIEDENLRKRTGKYLFKRVANHFSEGVVIKKLTNIYKLHI